METQMKKQVFKSIHAVIVLFLCIGITLASAVNIKAANETWEQLDIYGGLVNDVVFVGNDIYVASDGSGLMKSSDNGDSWTSLIDSISIPAGNHMHAVAVNGQEIYLAQSYRVYYSPDGGSSWSELISSAEVKDIQITATGDVFYLDTKGTLYKGSTNGGQPTPVFITSGNYINCMLIVPNAGSPATYDIYLGTKNDGIYMSTQGGAVGTWTQISTLAQVQNYEVNALAVDSTGWFFAGTSGGLFRSKNISAGWTPTQINNTVNVKGLAVDTSDRVYAISSTKVYLVTGAFVATEITPSDPKYHTLNTVSVSGTAVYLGTRGDGLLVSNDQGTSWDSGKFIGGYIDEVNVVDNTIYAANILSYVQMSNDEGNNWSYILPLIPGISSTYATTVVGNDIFVATTSGVSKSTSGGAWQEILTNNSVHSISADSAGNIYVASDDGVYVSNDGTAFAAASIGVRALRITVDGNNIYAATDDGVYLSSNQGASWNNIGLSGTHIREVAVLNGALFAIDDAVGNNSIYKSTDGGNSWNISNNGVNLNRMYALIASDHILYVGGEGGVFKSEDNGSSWTALDPAGLSNITVHSLDILGDYMYAGTMYHGIYKIDIPLLPTPNPGGTTVNPSPPTGVDGSAALWIVMLAAALSMIANGTYACIKERREEF